MRTLLLLVTVAFAACTVQPSGARCEQDQDCNVDQGDVCRNETNVTAACQGATSCICCPQNAAAAAAVPGCAATMIVTDAGADR